MLDGNRVFVMRWHRIWIRREAVGGVLLVGATVLSVIIATIPETPSSVSPGSYWWIKEGLMSVFFFGVGQ